MLEANWIDMPGIRQDELAGALVEYETIYGTGELGTLHAFQNDLRQFRFEIRVEKPSEHRDEAYRPKLGLIEDGRALRRHPDQTRAAWLWGQPSDW